MLTQEVLQDFQTLYEVEKYKIDRQLAGDIRALVSKYNSRGLLLSGAAASGVVDAASDTIPIRGQASLAIMLRAAGAHGVRIDRAAGDSILERLGGYLDNDGVRMREMVEDTPAFRQEGLVPDGLVDEIARHIDLEKRRISGEVGLVVAAASANDREQAAHQGAMTFNGPVGVVQTGPGSFGVANQRIDASSQKLIEAALTKIELGLGEGDGGAAEVRELVGDARSELSKVDPNTHKIRGLLQGIAGAISFLPKLKDGYDSLKWAGNLIGVHLP